jgi:hypothetical protein
MMSDDPNTPLVRQVESTSIASPHELRPRDPREVRWYKPSFGSALQMMGWRLVFFVPALALVFSLFLLPGHLWITQFLFVFWKLLLIAIVLPTGYALKLAKNALQARKEPFCIHCGYDLSGLQDDHACPECGEPYKFSMIEEYRRDPSWFIQRYNRRFEMAAVHQPFLARKAMRKKSRDGT